MLFIVQAKTAHGLYILQSQWRKQQSHVGNLIRHIMLSKDIAFHDLCLLSFCNIRDTMGQYCIAIVSSAILG
jgi:hypothetical protein